MKKLLLPLFSLLLLIFSCNRASIVEQKPITPPERSSYKIPLDSLKRQAVSLSTIFGSPATKSRVVRVKNAVEIGSLLGERSVSRSAVDDADAPRAYVVNFDGGAGFAILADDERLPTNIFAYCESGTLDATTDNPGVLLFLEEAEYYLTNAPLRIIETIHAPLNYRPNTSVTPSNWGVTSRAQCGWTYSAREVVIKAPLLSVNWGQSYPYNLVTPVINGTQCPTGCVATAAVQIMSYYQWPQSVSVNGQNWGVNWSAALGGDIIGANIHYLMRAVGNGVGMSYAPDGSSAYYSNVPGMYISYGYTCSSLSAYNQSTIITEINNRRPVYVSGQVVGNTTLGHAWVVDGYLKHTDSRLQVVDHVDDSDKDRPIQIGQRIKSQTIIGEYLYLHCNWGWNSYCNGYFVDFKTASGDMYDDPNVNNGVNYDLNAQNKIIYNIKH